MSVYIYFCNQIHFTCYRIYYFTTKSPRFSQNCWWKAQNKGNCRIDSLSGWFYVVLNKYVFGTETSYLQSFTSPLWWQLTDVNIRSLKKPSYKLHRLFRKVSLKFSFSPEIMMIPITMELYLNRFFKRWIHGKTSCS